MGGVIEFVREPYLISTDPKKLDLETIHAFLTCSYWAKGISKEKVALSMRFSVCFGVYMTGKQVGFARVLTDYVHSAHLGDVFILEEYRSKGLGKWLVECALAHPSLQELRRWTLATKDAHNLYSRFGFKPLSSPERFMQRDSPCGFGERANQGTSAPGHLSGVKHAISTHT